MWSRVVVHQGSSLDDVAGQFAKPARLRAICAICAGIEEDPPGSCETFVVLPTGFLKGYCARHWSTWPRSAHLELIAAAQVEEALLSSYGASCETDEALGSRPMSPSVLIPGDPVADPSLVAHRDSWSRTVHGRKDAGDLEGYVLHAKAHIAAAQHLVRCHGYEFLRQINNQALHELHAEEHADGRPALREARWPSP
jgi:hypothetical protein